MQKYHQQAQAFIDEYAQDSTVRESLQAYLDYMIQREL